MLRLLDRVARQGALLHRSLNIVARAETHGQRLAVVHPKTREAFTYDDLLTASSKLSFTLLNGAKDLQQARVAFLAPSTFDYVMMMWAVWRAGGVAVPLCTTHPVSELLYTIQDSQAAMVIAHPSMASAIVEALRGVADPPHLITADSESVRNATAAVTGAASLPTLAQNRRALIIYTSGTTGRPKGVVTTHEMIEAQVHMMTSRWGWSQSDAIYNVLPLHHVHGVINVVTTALYSGACCEMPPKFDAADTWSRLQSGGLTLFMAVPTIYSRLIAYYDAQSPRDQQTMSKAARSLRLMVSGSAALPDPIMKRWEDITGHKLLERYGMTETGMILTNPLNGPRLPGHVGLPFPGVTVKVVGEQEYSDPHTQALPDSVSGELHVKSPSVFLEYFNRPSETTTKEFSSGYFKTGDIVEYSPSAASYKIMGRASADIIKSAGYKISALDVERVLLAHPAVGECAVLGLPDVEYGERICAVIALRPPHTSLDLADLKDFASHDLPKYKLPTVLQLVPEVPKNAMGKVNKKSLRAEVLKSRGSASA